MADINNYNSLEKDESKRRQDLEKQLTNISLREQELQCYINILDNSIKNLESSIYQVEQAVPIDYSKLKSLRGALNNNIELINELYKTYNSYEDTKLKCQKEINDSTYKYNHLLHVAIRQLDEKTNKFSNEEFLSTLMAMNDMFKKQDNDGRPKFEPRTEFANKEDYEL